MADKLKILHLEDLPSDAELVGTELCKGKLNFERIIVDNGADFIRQLNEYCPDIILSDHSLPSFNSIEALEILKESGLNIPFILITATISEEFAVEVMRLGAYDYILKDRLQRLPNAILNAMDKWQVGNDKQKYFEKIIADERLLKEAQKIAHLGNWEIDFSTGKTTWSEEIYTIFGLNPGEAEPSMETYFSFIHPDDFGHVKNIFSESEETLKNIAYDNRIIRKDGETRYVSSRTNYVINGTGLPFKLQGILQDVTERRLIELQREFDSNNLKALINNTNDLMWSMDTEGKIITSNKSFDDMVKLMSGNEVIKGWEIPEAGFSKEQLLRWEGYYKRAFSGEMFTIIEQSDPPVELWSEISFYPIYNSHEVIGTACYSRNITERKLFERELEKNTNELFEIKEQLEHSELRLKQAQNIAHVGNWELNYYTGVTFWSDETCRIYGVSTEECKQTFNSWMAFIHPDDLEEVKMEINLSESNMHDSSFFHRIIRKDGEIRYVYTESRYEFDEDYKPRGLYGVVFDITERKKDEQELHNLLKVTTDQNIRLQNFAYIVSHNIRSHSANISGLVDFIDETGNVEKRIKFFDMLKTSTRKLGETIENLNEIITIQNDHVTKNVKVSLKNEINNTANAINSLILQTNTRLFNNVPDDMTVVVVPSYMESILLNIISNAIKYSSPDRLPEIRINAVKTHDFVVVSFQDNGIGIDLKKNGPKMFGMYKTFHNNKDARGFGLYITKNQIEVMGGKIEVESELGVGSTFKVYFSIEKN